MPTKHPQDILLVKNIDVDCDDVTTEIIQTTTPSRDEMGNPIMTYGERTDSFNHRESFQIKWGGIPHRIGPGQVSRLPRFVAEHFAKHLADHILQKLEIETNRRGLVQSVTERPRVINEILTGVEQWYLGSEDSQPVQYGTESAQPISEAGEVDAGVVTDPLYGNLQPEPKPLADVLATADLKAQVEQPQPVAVAVGATTDAQSTPVAAPQPEGPTTQELLIACNQMGIEVNGTESREQLIAKLKAF